MFARDTLALFLFLAASTMATANDRPNIVVFLCDDLGYGDLECYGHPHIKTPNLNQLADDGIRFTDFYSAAPVCSPSRVGLLTGRSPNRAGVYDWIPPGNKPLPDAREQVHMRASETTIPSLLKQAGYRTCMAGKWHCNGRFNSSMQPQPGDFGFDHWLATQNNASPSHANPVNFVRNGKPIGKVEGFSCQIVVDEAIDWMKQTEEDDRPFFLFVPFHETHEPVASPPELVDQYTGVSRNSDEAEYFANVANVDIAVGRFMAELDRRQIREETLVIFTSDNGPETLKRYQRAKRSYGQPGPLRGMKLHTTDAGFRVVGIMNWKGRIAAGQTSATPVSSLDFLPTFCKLAETPVPSALGIDGANFLPAINGDSMERTKPLVWAYFNALNEHRVAMRDGQWKVLAKIDGGSIKPMSNVSNRTQSVVADAKLTDIEIYDLQSDTSEATDLSERDPELTDQLTQKLDDAYRELVTHSHVWQVSPDVRK